MTFTPVAHGASGSAGSAAAGAGHPATARMRRGQATRKWVLLKGVIPAYLLVAPLEFRVFDAAEAAFHLAFGLAIAALLTELFFFSFNKVPFTCSYLPAKSHLAFLGGAYLYGFTIYTFTMSSLELWIGESAMRTAVFFLFVAGILVSVSVSRESPEIIYEDDADPIVRQLNLT